MVRYVALLALLAATLAAPAIAQPNAVWHTAADSVAVLSTGASNNFTYAIVRDDAMRGHSTYCVTIGAHIGKLTVVSIASGGIVLSNGRLLPNLSANAPTNALVAAGHK
jgi:hypothetical protein